jgi:peptide-methionine (S)-S-oxide reductase
MKLKLNLKIAVTMVAAFFFIQGFSQNKTNSSKNKMNSATFQQNINNQSNAHIDTATFGAGCFWCVEAVFQRLNGVISLKSGYTGGKIKNPTYKEVCSGLTGHAEVCQILYDNTKITFVELLEVFWKTHDPTTMNQQGNDHGTQYRSAVFYHNEQQKLLAEKYKKDLNAAHVYPNPIVTEVTPASTFYEAEDYHQDYFNANGSQPYCKFVIQPKVEKFEKIFKDKVKR